MGGDEPHYLVISHSIARDFDINVFNQYARDEYREFVDVSLQHHARVGKGFKVWYSYGHLPGLSLTLAPFFIYKIPHPFLYFLIRAFLGIFGALLAVLVYLFILKLWRNASMAIFIASIFIFTAPIFFFAIHIFAELQASLLILLSIYLMLFSVIKINPLSQFKKNREKSANKFSDTLISPQIKQIKKKKFFLTSIWSSIHFKVLLAGFSLGISVFWGLKFAIFIYLFSAGFFIYFVIKKQYKRAILFVLFPLLFQILFFGYLYFAYGNVDPMSIYNGVMTQEQMKEYQSNMQKIPLQKRIETLLGIFLDQRDGLLLYNPFYFLAFPGLLMALKKIKKYWPHLLISCAGFAFILFLGYSTVRPGYSPQARYLVPVALMFMIFAIIYYKETSNISMRKLFYILPIYAMGVIFYQIFHPFTLYQSVTHINLNRPGLMFQQWSNLFIDLPSLLPSFVKVPGNFSYLPNIFFLITIIMMIIIMTKKSFPKINKKFLRGFGGGLAAPANLGLINSFLLIFMLFALFPRIPTYNPILLTQKNALPCKIYGISRYPTRTNERKFELSPGNWDNFTISTMKPVSSIALEIEGGGNFKGEVEIYNFDDLVKRKEIHFAGTQKIVIENPKQKKYQNSYFYRLHFKIDPLHGIDSTLFCRILPLR